MSVLAVTLARGGSKSVLRKNIRMLDGKPLIAYTIEEVIKCKLITDYLVSTDDEEISKIVNKYGNFAPFLRPPELSLDTTSSVAALKHAVEWAEYNYKKRYDYVVEVMCTNPLKKFDDIDACISILLNTKADSVIAVHKLEDHHPARIKKIVNGFLVDFCVKEDPESRRQDLKPEAYIRSGSIYALRRDHLMIEGRRYGSTNSRPYILPQEKAINIDTELDFLLAEYLLKKNKQ